MNLFRLPTLLISTLALSVAGCDKAKDALSGEPQTSYCEALCDWASGCHAEARGVDEQALYEDCLEQTRSADSSCAEAESGDLNAGASATLTECTDAIDAQIAAGECSGFTGSIDEQKTATTPGACAGQGGDAQDTYNEARDATLEGNDEMCERFSTSFCEKLDTCLSEELGSGYDQAVDALGENPFQRCLDQSTIQTQEQSCKDDGLYEPEENLDDVNASRQAARECLSEFVELTCEQVTSGDMPELCAGAVEDPTAYAGAIFEIAEDYRDAAR